MATRDEDERTALLQDTRRVASARKGGEPQLVPGTVNFSYIAAAFSGVTITASST